MIYYLFPSPKPYETGTQYGLWNGILENHINGKLNNLYSDFWNANIIHLQKRLTERVYKREVIVYIM